MLRWQLWADPLRNYWPARIGSLGQRPYNPLASHRTVMTAASVCFAISFVLSLYVFLAERFFRQADVTRSVPWAIPTITAATVVALIL